MGELAEVLGPTPNHYLTCDVSTGVVWGSAVGNHPAGVGVGNAGVTRWRNLGVAFGALSGVLPETAAGSYCLRQFTGIGVWKRQGENKGDEVIKLPINRYFLQKT